MTYDGLTLYFASARSGAREIYRATRASRVDPWNTPVLVTELQALGFSDGYVAATPHAAGLDLMTSGRDIAGMGHELHLLVRAGGVWGMPRALSELSTPGTEAGSFLWGERMILFHSNRAGDNELYYATRPDRDSPFGFPEPIPGADPPGRQLDPWLSPDGQTLVFFSEHDTARLYYAVRTAP